MRYRTWLMAGTIVFAGLAEAGEVPTREEGVGMLTGAAGGALLAGPPGAIAGLALGAFVGDRMEIARRSGRHAAELQAQLTTTRTELAATRAALARAASDASGADDQKFLERLAERLSADVLFRTASDALDADGERRLAGLAGLLASIPDVVIELHGFADPRGDADANRLLSERRAERVRTALEAGGLDRNRMRVLAHGEDLSTAAPGDGEAYAWERRVRLGVVAANGVEVAQAPQPGR